jgi:hypothetical protein
VLRSEFRDMKGLFLGISWRTTVHILGDVEQVALDPRARWGLRAMARVAVVTLVILLLCVYLLAIIQDLK